jgi:hypothetical protein
MLVRTVVLVCGAGASAKGGTEMANVSGFPQRLTLGDGWFVPRSRGAVSGVLLVLLGIWGGLVPFWGPQFGYGYSPGMPWTFTWARLFLAIAPAVAVIVGGLGLLSASHRAAGLLAGWLAALGGAWFVVGPILSVLFGSSPGAPLSLSMLGSSVTQIGLFYGLGIVVVFLAALAIGRFSVLPTGQAGAGGTTERRAGRVGEGPSERRAERWPGEGSTERRAERPGEGPSERRAERWPGEGSTERRAEPPEEGSV